MPSAASPDLQETLLLSLEEMYHGCVKKVTRQRQVSKADGSSTREDRELTIDVSYLAQVFFA